MAEKKTIAIIGGGASGTLLAINLLESNSEFSTIVLIEKSNEAGRGLAFQDNGHDYLLNVVAGKMSAYSDKPSHFLDWLSENKIPATENTFLPRRIYGQYLSALLNEFKNHSVFVRIKDEALDIAVSENGDFEIKLRLGKSINAQKVVLALGNCPPPQLRGLAPISQQSENYINDPWKANLSAISKDKTVLIIGTGLTAVDIVLGLKQSGHTGKITCLSTHGHLPLVHNLNQEAAQLNIDWKGTLSAIISTAKANLKSGNEIMSSIRPQSQEIWIGFSLEEKKRFLRHLKHLWATDRHRMPKESSDKLNSMIQEGQLTVLGGKIDSINSKNNGFELSYTQYKSSELKTIACDYLINCTGPESNIERVDSVLIHNLLKKDLIKADELKLGIDAYPNGKVKNEFPAAELYAVGPMLRGILWEITAIPEIRDFVSKG